MNNWSLAFADQVMRNAKTFDQRTGQYLFNCLPFDAAQAVTGTLFDPFHGRFSEFEVREWIENHLIFSEGGDIIGVFNGDAILWDGDGPDMAVPAIVSG